MADSATLKKWLSTRKSGIALALNNGRHPGLFSTSEIEKDKLMLRLAILGEIVGGAAIIIGAANTGNTSWLILSIAVVFVTIMVDMLAGKIIHRHEGFRKWVECKSLVLANTDRVEDIRFLGLCEQYLSQKGRVFQTKFLIILVYSLALIKAYSFFVFNVVHPMIYIGATIGYFVIAYIHINHTGFRLAELHFQKYLKIDYQKFLNIRPEVQPLQGMNKKITLVTSIPLIEFSLESKVILEKLKDGEYQLTFLGMIFDNEIRNMRDVQQLPAAKDYLTLEALKTQLDLISAPSISNNKLSW